MTLDHQLSEIKLQLENVGVLIDLKEYKAADDLLFRLEPLMKNFHHEIWMRHHKSGIKG